MTISGRPHHSSPSRSALFVGLTVGAAGLTTGCGAPETGSLENTKQRPAPIDYSKLDYSKIDYSKIDYSKIDYSKIDYSKVDHTKLDHTKLDEKRQAELAARYVKLVDSDTISKEFTTRMRGKYDDAVKTGEKELVLRIEAMFKALEAHKNLVFDNPQRW